MLVPQVLQARRVQGQGGVVVRVDLRLARPPREAVVGVVRRDDEVASLQRRPSLGRGRGGLGHEGQARTVARVQHVAARPPLVVQAHETPFARPRSNSTSSRGSSSSRVATITFPQSSNGIPSSRQKASIPAMSA